MGDLLAATPVITAELNAGSRVVLLVFPQIQSFVELVGFGPNRGNLEVCPVPSGFGWGELSEFLLRMSRVTPQLVWISPHAPAVASSWKIPLLLWLIKQRYWRRTAALAGAKSERLSWLFDVRVEVDRLLPYSVREWRAYSMLPSRAAVLKDGPAPTAFIDRIQSARALPRNYDLLIHPGAAADNRKWPYEKYAALLDRIPERARVAVVGLPDDIAGVRAVVTPNRNVQFLTGTLESAITAIARTRVALTMDSGTMFFANMLGVPTVALFGPSDPVSVIGASSFVEPHFRPSWPCQPCKSPRCRQPAVYCMRSIEPDAVARQVLKLMDRAW